MNGTREYTSVLKNGQYGRLYICCDKHARGTTLHVYVLPDGVLMCADRYWSDAVEVYGITGGQPGWTETYGWLKEGPWQADFMKIVEDSRQRTAKESTKAEREAKEKKLLKEQHDAALLATYPRPNVHPVYPETMEEVHDTETTCSFEESLERKAAFAAAKHAVYNAFRWYCCEKNADQQGCTSDCPRKQALVALSRGQKLQNPRR